MVQRSSRPSGGPAAEKLDRAQIQGEFRDPEQFETFALRCYTSQVFSLPVLPSSVWRFLDGLEYDTVPV